MNYSCPDIHKNISFVVLFCSHQHKMAMNMFPHLTTSKKGSIYSSNGIAFMKDGRCPSNHHMDTSHADIVLQGLIHDFHAN